MDKETLSNYGWIVIAVLVLAVMIALATPFGDFIANGVKSTTQGMFDASQNALGAIGINIADQKIGATQYKMLNGADETFTNTTKVSFCSEAEIDKFVEVRVDDEVVDSSNYEVTEGSTIITFTSEYAKALAEGEHTIAIISTDGMAKCNFAIEHQKYIPSVTYREYELICTIQPTLENQHFSHDENCYKPYEVTLTWDELMEPLNFKKYGNNPDAITNNSIGLWAFPSCNPGIDYSETVLISIVIPEGIETINFYGQHHLENMTLPSTVTTFESGCFQFNNLKSLTFNGTIAQWNTITKNGSDLVSPWNSELTQLEYVQCLDGKVQLN